MPRKLKHGTDAVIDSYNNKRGLIRKRVPLIKAISSIITIGSGGSAGREGPIAQIGAGFGSTFASFLKLSDRDRRIMVICGTAAGIGSIFKAPLAVPSLQSKCSIKATWRPKDLCLHLFHPL